MEKEKKLGIAITTAALLTTVACGPIAPTETPALPPDPPALSALTPQPFTPIPAATQATISPIITATPSATPAPTAAPYAYEDGSETAIVRADVTRAEDLTEADIEDLVRQAVALSGGLEGIVFNGATVVLKPNLVQMRVDSTRELLDQEVNGVTADWRVTRAVAKMVCELNPDGLIYVMEGSATGRTKDVMEHFHYTKEHMPEVDAFFGLEEDSGAWQDTGAPELLLVPLEDGLLHTQYYFNRTLYEADLIISIPCLKTTNGVVVTAGIKNVCIGTPPGNIYGVSPTEPGKTKMVSHKISDGHLDRWIVDYFRCKPVDFVVVDGLQGFQRGPVPSTGERKQTDKMNMRLILAGADAVSVDTACALVIGWDPESVGYLQTFRELDIGHADPAYMRIAGTPVAEVRADFAIRKENLGGVKIQKHAGPELSIEEATVSDGQLHLSGQLSDDAIKLEVYIDGQLRLHRAVASGAWEASLDFIGFDEDADITVIAYDRFLNQRQQTAPPLSVRPVAFLRVLGVSKNVPYGKMRA